MAEMIKTKQAEWEKYAGIRTKPRYLLLEPEEGQHYFPIARQPICSHEIVQSLGDDVIQYILIQSLYRNLYEIAKIETGIIYAQAITIATNQNFPPEIAMDAFTVAIDEVYHAYRASDIMQQLSLKTAILPLSFPTAQLELALSQAKHIIPLNLHQDFQLVAVSITESIIGSEAASLTKEEGIHKTMREFTYDHMVDEVRHSRIFAMILRTFWSSMPKCNQEIIGKVLPTFISNIFQPESQKLFDRMVLQAVGISEEKIDLIMDQTYTEGTSPLEKKNQGNIDNVLKFLYECEVFI